MVRCLLHTLQILHRIKILEGTTQTWVLADIILRFIRRQD